MGADGENSYDSQDSAETEANDIEANDISRVFPAGDVDDLQELADAERAVAHHGGTAEQVDGVAKAGRARRAEDRLTGWRQRRDTSDMTG